MEPMAPISDEVRARWTTARIRVAFYSPPVWYTPPLLDSLVAYALNREATLAEGRGASFCGPGWDRQGIWHQLREIVRQAGGCSVCTAFRVDGVELPARESIKKRFEARYRHLVDWGGRKAKLNTSAAPWRAYDKPMPAHACLGGWWDVCGDVARILDLLRSHVVGVGKDVNAGFGWIRQVTAEPIEATTQDILRQRPVPVAIAEQLGIAGGRVEVCAWRAPYWSRANVAPCVVPA